MNKKVSLWVVFFLLWFSVILAVTFGWAVYHVCSTKKGFGEKTNSLIMSIANFPGLIRQSLQTIKTGSMLIRQNHFPDIHGLKVENKYVDSNYMLLATFDKQKNQSVVKLLRLKDQVVIHQWEPDFEKLRAFNTENEEFWKSAILSNLQMYHPLLSNDGSVIFSTVVSPLIKIDKDSKVEWILKGTFSHSLEFDADGNIWALEDVKHAALKPNLDEFEDNELVKVSPDGKKIYHKSVAEALIENGYRGLLLGGLCEPDMLHTNDVQPALTTTSYWQKGDLLVSIRHKSTVLLYRPSTGKIIWLKTGPWLNQHDVDFLDSSHIGIFGNNIVRNDLHIIANNSIEQRVYDGFNVQYIYDFKTDKVDTPYNEFLRKANVATVTEGRSDILPNGDIFIEETNMNRLLRGNKNNTIWQYVDRIDDQWISAISWSRFILAGEYNKLTFLKNK